MDVDIFQTFSSFSEPLYLISFILISFCSGQMCGEPRRFGSGSISDGRALRAEDPWDEQVVVGEHEHHRQPTTESGDRVQVDICTLYIVCVDRACSDQFHYLAYFASANRANVWVCSVDYHAQFRFFGLGLLLSLGNPYHLPLQKFGAANPVEGSRADQSISRREWSVQTESAEL